MQAFCWLCGESTGREHTWSSISGHSCGRYSEETSARIDEAQRNVKRYTARAFNLTMQVFSRSDQAVAVLEVCYSGLVARPGPPERHSRPAPGALWLALRSHFHN